MRVKAVYLVATLLLQQVSGAAWKPWAEREVAGADTRHSILKARQARVTSTVVVTVTRTTAATTTTTSTATKTTTRTSVVTSTSTTIATRWTTLTSVTSRTVPVTTTTTKTSTSIKTLTTTTTISSYTTSTQTVKVTLPTTATVTTTATMSVTATSTSTITASVTDTITSIVTSATMSTILQIQTTILTATLSICPSTTTTESPSGSQTTSSNAIITSGEFTTLSTSTTAAVIATSSDVAATNTSTAIPMTTTSGQATTLSSTTTEVLTTTSLPSPSVTPTTGPCAGGAPFDSTFVAPGGDTYGYCKATDYPDGDIPVANGIIPYWLDAHKYCTTQCSLDLSCVGVAIAYGRCFLKSELTNATSLAIVEMMIKIASATPVPLIVPACDAIADGSFESVQPSSLWIYDTVAGPWTVTGTAQFEDSNPYLPGYEPVYGSNAAFFVGFQSVATLGQDVAGLNNGPHTLAYSYLVPYLWQGPGDDTPCTFTVSLAGVVIDAINNLELSYDNRYVERTKIFTPVTSNGKLTFELKCTGGQEVDVYVDKISISDNSCFHS